MKAIKAAVTGTVVAALAGGGLMLGATSASASTPPGYAPDANVTGGVVFYNAAGTVITGGTDLTHLFDYAAATTGPTGGRVTTKGQTTFGVPDHTKPNSTTWFQAQSSAATNYPLVRVRNSRTGAVRYCRTSNHTSMGVATGAVEVTTTVEVPADLELGRSVLEVVANGIASEPFRVNVVDGDDKQQGLGAGDDHTRPRKADVPAPSAPPAEDVPAAR